MASSVPVLVSAALLVVSAGAVGAQDETALEPHPWRWAYTYGGLGYFDGKSQPTQLQGNDTGFGLGGGIGQRLDRHFAFDLDALFVGRVYETPGTTELVDDQMTLTNLTLSADLRLLAPFWKLEPYVGVGLGLIVSEIEIESSAYYVTAVSETHFGLSTQLMVGLSWIYTRRSRIGIEYRRVFAEADFGDLSRGTVDVGGGVVAIRVALPL
jgi:opacity protein-like surface antigen